MDARIICIYGGSSASKTISALQYLTVLASSSITPLTVTIVGESLPVVKKTVLRDWQRLVMKEAFKPYKFNKVDYTYYFDNRSLFQFMSADDARRFHGIRQDFTMIDEAYNVSHEVFDQLEIRTRRQVILTWNPVSPFWATRLQDLRKDVAVIHSTYMDNPYLEQSFREALEIRAKTDPNFHRVYVLGEYGTLEGLIFKEGEHWNKCTEMPDTYKRGLFVLDFGFTQDPTAILEIRYSDGKYWINELLYKPGMHNDEIYKFLSPLASNKEVIADAAEPKSISELRRMRLNIIPAQKGPDSVKFGISTMQSSQMMITETSDNTIKELRNYSYQKDKHGELIEKPIDAWNHSIDAIRYGITHLKQRPNYGRYSIS